MTGLPDGVCRCYWRATPTPHHYDSSHCCLIGDLDERGLPQCHPEEWLALRVQCTGSEEEPEVRVVIR